MMKRVTSESAGISSPKRLKRANLEGEIESAMQTQAIAPQMHSRLLSMPGEIRNLTYEYSTEEEDFPSRNPDEAMSQFGPAPTSADGSDSSVHFFLGDQSGIYHQSTGTRTNYYAMESLQSFGHACHREFFGLTQVSRLIRKEFVPKYRAKTHVRVRLPDAAAFIKTWYPLEELDKVVARDGRKITVQIPWTVET